MTPDRMGIMSKLNCVACSDMMSKKPRQALSHFRFIAGCYGNKQKPRERSFVCSCSARFTRRDQLFTKKKYKHEKFTYCFLDVI
jgi:hypothetical protein